MAMKLFAAIIALVLQGAIVTPAIPAEYPMTQAHCEKAGSEVKKKEAHKCEPSVRVVSLSPAERILGLIGLGSAVVGLILVWRDFG
jgi:hypothetical protein